MSIPPAKESRKLLSLTIGNFMINKKYATHSREPFFEIANKHIKVDSKVLDIGAGSGKFSKTDRKNYFTTARASVF